MTHITLTLQGLSNGTWVACVITPGGFTKVTPGPSPSDAAIAALEALGVDNLHSFVRAAKAKSEERDEELEKLRSLKDELFKSHDKLRKDVAAMAAKIREDWPGRYTKQHVASLESLSRPWP